MIQSSGPFVTDQAGRVGEEREGERGLVFAIVI
jgi:hypothetical protein